MPDGTIYIADSDNNLIRKIDTNKKITTIAGDRAAATKAATDYKAGTISAFLTSDSAGDSGPASTPT